MSITSINIIIIVIENSSVSILISIISFIIIVTFVLMSSFVNIKSASGANMVLVEPRFNAVRVKVMLTPQLHNLVSFPVRNQANGAHVLLLYLVHSLRRHALQACLVDSEVLLDVVFKVLVINAFKGLRVNAWNRRLKVISTLRFQDGIVFVVPVDEVQVVLPFWVNSNWSILPEVLLFRRVRSFVQLLLRFLRLFLLFKERLLMIYEVGLVLNKCCPKIILNLIALILLCKHSPGLFFLLLHYTLPWWSFSYLFRLRCSFIVAKCLSKSHTSPSSLSLSL